MTPTILCCGEPLIVLTPHRGEDLVTGRELEVGVAGAELNVALHLARLGLDVRYAGAVGTDPFGARIREVLVGEGVDDRALHALPDRRTGVYFKQPGDAAHDGSTVHYYRDHSAAASDWPLDAADLEGVGHVHVTGVSAAVSSDFLGRLSLLTAPDRRWTVSFDLNHRPSLWATGAHAGAGGAAGVLRDLALRCDIVLVGMDEATEVWGTDSPEAVRDLLAGVPEVVVKDGPHPASVWSDGQWVTSEPLPVAVVELVGAGDAFASAYLAARLSGRGPRTAMKAGHLLAAHVISETGDQGSADAAAYAHIREAMTGRSTTPSGGAQDHGPSRVVG